MYVTRRRSGIDYPPWLLSRPMSMDVYVHTHTCTLHAGAQASTTRHGCSHDLCLRALLSHLDPIVRLQVPCVLVHSMYTVCVQLCIQTRLPQVLYAHMFVSHAFMYMCARVTYAVRRCFCTMSSGWLTLFRSARKPTIHACVHAHDICAQIHVFVRTCLMYIYKMCCGRPQI